MFRTFEEKYTAMVQELAIINLLGVKTFTNEIERFIILQISLY